MRRSRRRAPSMPTPRSCARKSSSARPPSTTCCSSARLSARIEAKSDHTVPEEFFHDMLDEQFTEEETLRQLETAINWGRYAELFDFDAARRRFIQPETNASDEPVTVSTILTRRSTSESAAR